MIEAEIVLASVPPVLSITPWLVIVEAAALPSETPLLLSMLSAEPAALISVTARARGVAERQSRRFPRASGSLNSSARPSRRRSARR